jgi:hypothetical protein
MSPKDEDTTCSLHDLRRTGKKTSHFSSFLGNKKNETMFRPDNLSIYENGGPDRDRTGDLLRDRQAC